MKHNEASIILCLTAVFSVIALPVIRYVGGRQCCPLVVPCMFPAEIVPYFIWLVAVIILLIIIGRPHKGKKLLLVPITAFAIALFSLLLFFVVYNPCYVFLLGLKTRFENNPGYATMREYAKEVSLEYDSLKDPNNIEDFLARYSFLDCAVGSGHFNVRNGIVEHGWGSALIGHWGFQVSLNGVIGEIERGTTLRVASDIQFVYYDD